MNERIDTTWIPVPAALVGEYVQLLADYIRLIGGEPSVVVDLVQAGVIEQGLRGMRLAYEREADRRYAVLMGWSSEEEEMGT